MVTYNHAFTIAFEVSGSIDPRAEDITSEQFREAIIKRMDNLDSVGELEWKEALGAPFDSYEEVATEVTDTRDDVAKAC